MENLKAVSLIAHDSATRDLRAAAAEGLLFIRRWRDDIHRDARAMLAPGSAPTESMLEADRVVRRLRDAISRVDWLD